MADIHALILKADSTQIKNSATDLDRLSKSAKVADTSTGKLGKTTKNTSQSLMGMKTAVISIVAALGVDKLIKYADTMTLVNSRMQLATETTMELVKAQKELFDIAQDTRTSFAGTVDLYSRIARSTKDYNVEQVKLLELTDSINKAMIVSGGTAESMNSAVIQLGQAFSADFQAVGQELQSIREQTPRLYEALLKGTNLSSKAFKKLAEEGGLSSKMIIDAISNQVDSIDKDFTKINVTVSQAMTNIDNSILQTVGNLNDATGATAALAKQLQDYSKMLDDNQQALAHFALFTVATIER